MWLLLKPTNIRTFNKSKNDERYIVMDTTPDTDYIFKINENTFCSEETYLEKSYLGLGEKIDNGYLILRNIKDLDKSFVSYDGIGDYRTGILYYYPERNNIEIIIYLNENTFEMIEKKLENLNLINTIELQLSEREVVENSEDNWLRNEYHRIEWNIGVREYGVLSIGECNLCFSNEDKEIINKISGLNNNLIEHKTETTMQIIDIKNELISIKNIQILNQKTIKFISYLIVILILITIFK